MGKRLDVVLLLNDIIFILEYKTGDQNFTSESRAQVFNYAIDLSGYHRGSKDRVIVPILIATGSGKKANDFSRVSDKIYSTLDSDGNDLISIILNVLSENPCQHNDVSWYSEWELSGYLPTPTIVEAATDMFSNHDVERIANCESADNLTLTNNAVLDVIRSVSQDNNGRKAICFVTGVPGAGKTLVGLNIANAQHIAGQHAVYLSGNGPLVAVLTEALARNTVSHKRINPITHNPYSKDEAKLFVHSFIQPVHHYRDITLKKLIKENGHFHLQINPTAVIADQDRGYAEVESVAIFDEAQRAWKKEDLSNFIKDKNFPMSESAFFLWAMNLRQDSSVVVCLVGNGQEINHGEAGIAEWVRSIIKFFPDWEIHLSRYLAEKELRDEILSDDDPRCLLNILNDDHSYSVFFDDNLHLMTSMRSLRSEKIADFVTALLSHNIINASSIYRQFKESYPIVLTRSISKAKEWLKEKGAEQQKKWLDDRGFDGSIRDWMKSHLHEETLKSYFESQIPKTDVKKWIQNNFPCEESRNLLCQAANARGGKIRDRVCNAATPNIYKEFFMNKCPVVEVYEWIRDELPESDDRTHLLESIPRSVRYGLVASSAAKRLKAFGIDVKNEKDVSLANWFLDPANDVRSSNFMEEVVSEFVVQGLELDYVGLIWDADFRSVDTSWEQYKFVGSSWQTNTNDEYKDYQLNAYRVLLTRARLGMVIVVPNGDNMHIDGTIDSTRLPEFYDGTYEYLKSLGIKEI